ncbi:MULTISPECIES: acyl-CoA synthetase [unclassified Acidocella]|uniref:acyl-CoA synthetase n=1 Tax=unclassified Acidocella TaxID=2648610 RepID=UPI00028E1528|nr:MULTISPECIES: acyl-CoA synthetase [unclassified Acidocella]EKM98358.1 acyl-CoA synthetase [Acidocella sp. MX-AZ02]WBO59260.1 acyl-CoA synthetase [Acidocella sp. MX-AZ03]
MNVMSSIEAAPRGGVAPCSKRVMNLSHFLRQAGRRHGDEIGFVHGAQHLTWAQLEVRVDAMALALAARGVVKGDRILVQSRNCNQLFESMFACFRIGAVWVPTNYRQSPAEVAYLAEASGASVMICQDAFPAHAQAVQEAVGGLKHLITIGEGGESYEALVAEHLGQTCALADVTYDDPCWFFFTSGTTGRPKAGVLTHGQMGFVITNHLCDLMPGTTHEDASLVVAPLSHGAGIHQLVQVARAVKTVLPASDKLDPDEVWELVARWKITNMFTVPTIVKLLTEHKAVDEHDHSSLRYVIYAGAPMYREDQKFALRKLGRVLVQYFGLGEVTGNITVLPPSLHEPEDHAGARIGTCGIERTGMQVSIQDEQGKEMQPGETGEICVCGLAVFAGYYNNPEANAKAFRNGWFRTGDLGHLDRQGFLFITGRASDMYISGGSNVYPREVEELLLTHPAVAEVAIVGVPDRMWGEVGVAVLVTRPGASISEAEVMAFLDGKIARYKMPKQVFFWDELPKSGYGKITKKIVRDELYARGCLTQDAPSSVSA